MKLFSWAQKKLLPSFSHSSDKNQLNAGRLSDIRRQFHACDENIQASGSRDTHAEVLTIGTLGMGNLLSLGKDKVEEEEDNDDYVDDDDEVAHSASPIADSLSPAHESTSSNHELISSHRESVSSNRESVSSIDIQKLQEELQKILYFKLGQADTRAPYSMSTKGAAGSSAISVCKGGPNKAAKAGKQKARRGGYGDGGEEKSVRELLPLHSFLEMPMDTVSCKMRKGGGEGAAGFHKLLTKRHYWLLMQSLKSRLLHSATPTHINIPPALFESLASSCCNEPTSKVVPPYPTTTMEKAYHLLQKVTKRGPSGWKKWNRKADHHNNERTHASIDHHRKDEEEEESLNWAISRSFIGSERFINYITTTLAQIDKNDYTIGDNQHQGHHCGPAFQFQERDNIMQRRICNVNESWIDTDNEYLVLEL